MAQVTGNLLTPQQAAMNQKKQPSLLAKLFTPMGINSARQPAPPPTPVMQTTPIAPNVNLPKQPVIKPAGTVAPATQQNNAGSSTGLVPLTPTSSNAAPPGTANGTVTPDATTNTSLIGRIFEELLARGKQAPTSADDIAKTAAKNEEIAGRARDIASRAGAAYADIGKKGAGATAGYSTTGTQPVAEGNAAVVARTTSAAQTAVAEGAQTELQGIDKELAAANQEALAQKASGDLAKGALDSAGGFATPVQQPFNTQLVDPITGQPIPQGAGGAAGMQDAIKLQISRLAAGTGSYDQAVSALQAYGQPGINALNSALGPNFDPAKSNANAAAKAAALNQNVQQGRSVELASNSAYAALDKLGNELGKLSPLYKAGIPITNNVLSDIANFLGNSAVSQYQSTLNDARSQVAAVLAATGGSTPTDAMSTARGYLPDGMTAQQLTQKVAAVKELIQQKVDAFTQTGNVPQYGDGSSSTPTKGFDW